MLGAEVRTLICELTWAITVDNNGEYTLRFDGTGEIPDFANNNAALPWKVMGSTRLKLVFGSDVTRIGKCALHNMYFSTIDWGGVTCIGNAAFTYGNITTISIPGTVKTIEDTSLAEAQ